MIAEALGVALLGELVNVVYCGRRLRDSIVVSISACHVEDPGSIPGRGAETFFFLSSREACT